MRVINVRNVHEALPEGIRMMTRYGYEEGSRNGAVRLFDTPVTTRYRMPQERVIFHPLRDANPFFHLYESLWMLAGKRDVKSVAHYVKRMAEFSDDGKTFHGAYGYRWRKHFKVRSARGYHRRAGQEPRIDRRCVLQMWDARTDLGKEGKDFPCNTMATFRYHEGKLDMTVMNRSNDMIWGAYGANAVHFSFLQEYIAGCLGLMVGDYYQVSTNFHAYEATFIPLLPLAASRPLDNPYFVGEVAPMPLFAAGETQAQFDLDLSMYMDFGPIVGFTTEFFRKMVTPMHHAHEVGSKAMLSARIAPSRY
jgi:hypothetical protein